LIQKLATTGWHDECREKAIQSLVQRGAGVVPLLLEACQRSVERVGGPSEEGFRLRAGLVDVWKGLGVEAAPTLIQAVLSQHPCGSLIEEALSEPALAAYGNSEDGMRRLVRLLWDMKKAEKGPGIVHRTLVAKGAEAVPVLLDECRRSIERVNRAITSEVPGDEASAASTMGISDNEASLEAQITDVLSDVGSQAT